ncbi:MAG: GTP 3',8-cyclase MoaA [Myxococcota bacterium]
MSLTLRVNLGEQCQLECGYCLPSCAPVTPKSQRLLPRHYGRIGVALQAFAPKKIRFTGGEPLLHDELVDVVAAFHWALPEVPLAVTTNGALLPARLDALVEAGLSAATVHLDSLQPRRYQLLMGGGDLRLALDGLAAAKAKLRTVKVNVVVQRGLNDDELDAFLDWSVAQHVEVRFIELMNTGSASAFTRTRFLPGSEVVRKLGAQPVPRRSPNDPAALFYARGVTFGVIASDSAPFCGGCDRLRLSPSGVLRGCLYAPHGVDMGAMLRSGARVPQLRSALRLAVAAKRSHHPSLKAERAPFSMAAIGG